MFRDIVGQDEAIKGLKLAIDNNRLPHALLISGNEGAGGLAIAFAAAQYLMCPERTAESLFGDDEQLREDACGECAQCIQIQKLQHPDLHFVFPVVKKDKDVVSTDYMAEWREAFLENQYITYNEWVAKIAEENKQAQIFVSEANRIIRVLSTKPYESDYRVMIIWLPEKLREDAANKLLKIIEEPYEKTHFIMVSNDPEHIIGTIISRVQRLNLRLVNPAEQTKEDDEDRAYFREKFITMMRMSYARRLFDMKDWSEEMAGIGREKGKAFMQYAQQMIRENFIMNVGVPELIYMNDEEKQFSSRFHPFINEKNIFGIMEELEKAEKDITMNVSMKMVFFDLSLKLIMLLKTGNS